MSLTVQKLNADTTFLLAFAPPFAPSKCSKRFPGAFTILIDPWLAGQSSILHPSFQISKHTVTSSIASLAELKDEIDLIVISQDKPDHCHRATLCSLPKSKQVNILATPAAAKKIKSWRHFDDDRIHTMPTYNPKRKDSIIRIKLPSYTSTSKPGEITIAHMPTKRDLTGLHNALGITYRPPSTILTTPLGGRVDLLDSSPLSSKTTSAKSRPSTSASRPTTSDGPRSRSRSRLMKSVSTPILRTKTSTPALLKRTDSAHSSRPPTSRSHERTLSVLYTPHGVSPSLIQPWATFHLAPLRALPLTALFHSFTQETNLWFLGGVVVTGAPGGLELVKKFGARWWVSAHDEAKENKGVVVKWIRTRVFGEQEVKKLVEEVCGVGTQVVGLEVGGEVAIGG